MALGSVCIYINSDLLSAQSFFAGFGLNSLKLFICVCVCVCTLIKGLLQGRKRPPLGWFSDDALQLFLQCLVLDKDSASAKHISHQPVWALLLSTAEPGHRNASLTISSLPNYTVFHRSWSPRATQHREHRQQEQAYLESRDRDGIVRGPGHEVHCV